MNILVTFAVAAEFAPWRRRRKFLRLPGDVPRFHAHFGGAQVQVVLTGMGREHALRSTRPWLRSRPDLCISTGFAGGLRAGQRPGEVLAARLVGEAGEPVAVASHPELLSVALDCGARPIDRLASSPGIVARAEEKRKLSPQAEAVDMESYTILAEAARCGVPAIAVRAVSDTLAVELPYDFSGALDGRGQLRASAVAKQILKRPSGLPALLSLAHDCRTAARQLAGFLDAYTGTLADRLIPVEPDMVHSA